MAATVIEEFLISAGIKFDQHSFNTFQGHLKDIRAGLQGFAEAARNLLRFKLDPQIGRHLAALRQGLAGLGTAMGGFGRVAGLAGRAVAGFAGGLGLAAAGAVALVAFLLKARREIEPIVKRFFELHYASEDLGVSTGRLMSFNYAMEQIGISAETTRGQLAHIADSIRWQPAFTAQLAAIGVATHKANGELKETDEILEDLAEQYRKRQAQGPMAEALFAGWITRLGIDPHVVRRLALPGELEEERRARAEHDEMLRAAGYDPKTVSQTLKARSDEIVRLMNTLNTQMEIVKLQAYEWLLPLAAWSLKAAIEFNKTRSTLLTFIGQVVSDFRKIGEGLGELAKTLWDWLWGAKAKPGPDEQPGIWGRFKGWWQRTMPTWLGGGEQVDKSAAPGGGYRPTIYKPGAASADDPRGMIPVVMAAARAHGIDPNVGLAVTRAEGLGRFLGDRGTSGGALQLHVGGGLGDEFRKETGLDPLDPKNEPATIDWGFNKASQVGWRDWHGAARIGITGRMGMDLPRPPPATGPGSTGFWADVDKALEGVAGGLRQLTAPPAAAPGPAAAPAAPGRQSAVHAPISQTVTVNAHGGNAYEVGRSVRLAMNRANADMIRELRGALDV